MKAWLWTALITPFTDGNGIDNPVDYEALKRLLHMQIDAWVDGVLLLGTTGERPTLLESEEIELIKFSINILKGKTQIMVNAGTYSTLDTLHTISYLDKIDGIDAYLIVNPYYNKPTQTGLKKHFIAAAKQTKREIVLYNIMGRTGVNIETKTLVEIIEAAPNVVGVKEASWNLEQMKEVISQTPDNFIVLSGDDALSYDLIQNGGDGVISVASNCEPAVMRRFIDACVSWDPRAYDMNVQLKEFFSKLFLQTNPLPAKTYLAHKWIISENFRLPICPMDDIQKKAFLSFITTYTFP